jgi:hypothetical protein
MTTLISGGCVRLYTGFDPENPEIPVPQPEWHINEAHHTIGVIDTTAAPEIDAGGYLVVTLIGDDSTRAVVSMTAASDETLTARGITAGCSNGGPICRIRFYKDGVGVLDLNNPVHWAYVAGTYSNLWLTLVHDVFELAA